jgi:taurine dioxygenase
MDRIRLYDLLPDDLKQRIDRLSVVYRFQPDMMKRKYCRPARHGAGRPLNEGGHVRRRRARPRLSAGPPTRWSTPSARPGGRCSTSPPLFAVGIAGMHSPEGDALLAEVIEHCCTADFAYFHQWEEGDMIIWDNWRAMHSAEGVPPQYSRRMQRTSLKGDYGPWPCAWAQGPRRSKLGTTDRSNPSPQRRLGSMPIINQLAVVESTDMEPLPAQG